jgi:hypothetical protein
MPGGADIPLTYANVNDYVTASISTRVGEAKQQALAIRKGFNQVRTFPSSSSTVTFTVKLTVSFPVKLTVSFPVKLTVSFPVSPPCAPRWCP